MRIQSGQLVNCLLPMQSTKTCILDMGPLMSLHCTGQHQVMALVPDEETHLNEQETGRHLPVVMMKPYETQRLPRLAWTCRPFLALVKMFLLCTW